MKKGRNLWTRDQLILAINLYCKLPFGKLHKGNPKIIELANLIGRSPNAVAYKLVNFASLDPSLQARGIKGAQNSSKLDKEIWNEFYLNWEELAYISEDLLSSLLGKNQLSALEELSQPPNERTESAYSVKRRVNQSFFRQTILASYNYTCCITGIDKSELLIAGHIRPWSVDRENRLNPRNGLALNSLHDRAFENGLITITPDYIIRVSSELKSSKKPIYQSFFEKYDGKEIILPSRFFPDPNFLKYHNHERFRP